MAVDENFKPFAPSSPLTWGSPFYPSTGTPTGKTYEANGAGTPYFSVRSVRAYVGERERDRHPQRERTDPRGLLLRRVHPSARPPGAEYPAVDLVAHFYHSYYTTCTDEFTGKQDAYCAPYYFQQLFDCTSWQCVNGSTNPNPPGNLHGGIRVIPMIESDETYLDLYPSAAPGTLQW